MTESDAATERPRAVAEGVPVAITRDARRRKQTEETLRFLARVSDTLAQSLSQPETLERIARLIVPYLADWCQIYLVEGDTLCRVAVAHATPDAEALARRLSDRIRLAMEPTTAAADAFRTGRPILLAQLTEADLRRAAATDEDRRILDALAPGSAIVVPLSAQGRLLGAIALIRTRGARPYSHDDVEVAHQVSRRAALAIDNARLYRSEQEARERAERAVERLARLQTMTAALAEASSLLASSLDYDAILQQALHLFVRTLGGWATLDLVADDGVVHRVAVDHPDPTLQQRLLSVYAGRPLDPDGEHPVARVLLSGRATNLEQVSDSDLVRIACDADHLALLRDLNPTTGMAVPLVARNRIVGVVAIATSDPSRCFGTEDLTFATELAHRCAVAIDNARLHAQTSQAETLQRRLADLSRLLAEAHLDLDAIVAVVTRAAAEAVGEHAAILLVSDQGTTIYPVAVWDPDSDRLSMRQALLGAHPLRVGLGWTGQVVQTGKALFMPTVDVEELRAHTQPEHRSFVERLFRYGWIIVPMRLHGQTIGALSAGRGNVDRPYSRQDLVLLQEMADRTAMAIENVRLYRAERGARERAEEGERRFAFLAEASAVLGSSLDYQTTLQRVANLAVPTLADWCTVYIVDPDQRLRQVAVSATQPATADVLRTLGEHYLPTLGSSSGSLLLRAIHTGEPQIVAEYSDAQLQANARDADHLRLLRELRARSRIAAPIAARGRVVGGIVLATAESERQYGPADLHLALELAHRAAVAMDNAALYDEAQAAIRTRDEFLSVAAHELKTPVTGIKGTAQLLVRFLEHGQLDDARLRRYAQTIVTGSDRLAALTNDLLDVARIRAGRLDLAPRDVDLTVLVGEVVARFREQGDGRHDLQVVRPPDAIWLTADPDRLEQVLVNLLENAVKYSPAGGTIRVIVAAAPECASVRVVDPGIGLPAGSEEAIFQPFNRATNAARRHLPGMGLGLHICRTIVEQHGGRLWAESAGEDQGTTLILVLPRRGQSPDRSTETRTR